MLTAAAAIFAVALWSCIVNAAEPEAKPPPDAAGTPRVEATPAAEGTPEAEPVQAAEHARADERDQMVREQIESRGVRDPRVLAALRAVPRHELMPVEDFRWSIPKEKDGPRGMGAAGV